jgi:hypothetical protein
VEGAEVGAVLAKVVVEAEDAHKDQFEVRSSKFEVMR